MRSGLTTPAIMAVRGLLYCGRMPPIRAIAPEAPDLADELPAASLDAAAVENGGSWSQVRLSDAALPGLAATGLSFREAGLARVDLTGARLINLAFADVELDACSLATVDARSGSMRRVTARGCRLTGLLWTEGALRDVLLTDCAIDLASFAASTIEHVVFERCILRQTDFQDADLRLVRLVDCDLTGADLSGARLAHCQLEGCTLDGLRGAESLRGAAMPWADILASAGTFADALGIRVLDADD
jgi:uncharacterized protein YjbI with pentapeptide repeats